MRSCQNHLAEFYLLSIQIAGNSVAERKKTKFYIQVRYALILKLQ
jgi:hypothetical protein